MAATQDDVSREKTDVSKEIKDTKNEQQEDIQQE